MPLHSALVLENGIHTIVALRYANAAARIGAVGLATTDIGKVAQQSDDLTLWLLSAVTPAVVWSAVNTDSTASILSDAEDYADGAAAAAVAGIPDATAALKGLATAAQISRLDGIPPDAQSAQQVASAASSAVSAIPDATTLVKGLATTALVADVAALVPSVAALNGVVLSIDFSTPGQTLPTGSAGEIVHFSRASAAPFYLNGVLMSAPIDAPRITHEGIIIEPATTNLASTPETLSGWSLNSVTRGIGAATPEGGTYTRVTMTADLASLHALYSLATDPGLASSISVYASKVYGGNARYLQIQDNSTLHYARVDLLTGVVVQLSAANTVARCVDLGSEWRISWTANNAINFGAIWVAISNTNPVSQSPICDGAITDWVDVRRVQVEALDHPTSWVATTRAADICWLSPRAQILSEFCVEVDYQPVDGNNERGSVSLPRPIVSIGDIGTNSSMLIALAGVYELFRVFDVGAGSKEIANNSAAGMFYTGPRYLSCSSSGLAVPAQYIDGRQTNAAPTGAGTGCFQSKSASQSRVRIGHSATSGVSNGAIYGGVIVRKVLIHGSRKPTTRVSGAFSYREAMTRGYCPDNQVFACLGDSITDAVMVSPTTIYESWTRYAARTKGLNWMAHNYGVGSNSLDQIGARWIEHVKGRGYSTVVFQGGINNMNAYQSAAEAWSIAQPILMDMLASGVTKLICIGLMPGNNAVGNELYNSKTGYNSLLSAWCVANASLGVVYLDAWALMTDGANPPKIAAAYDQATPGSLHLNQAGNDRLGAAVAALL